LTGSAQSFTRFPTDAYSAFASLSLELVDGLKSDGGLRYTHERKKGSFVRNTVGTLAGGFPTVAFTRYAPKVSNPLDYNAGLRYQATTDLMLYGTYSKGT
jgi:outer membrane receptor protein involved in Fe transport